MYIKDPDPPIKILIVEDNSLYRKIIIDFLNEDSNFKVAGEAKDGKTAVSLAKGLRPNLIIMDIGLPVMSGLEATIKIKKANPSIKIMILTSHIDQNQALEALAAGATAYVNKNINMNQMKMIIETVNNGAIWIAPLVGQKILSLLYDKKIELP
jgi:DNA-binding NarL/FixJ family response regulator